MEAIRARLRGKAFDAVLLAYPWALSFLGEALKDSSAPVFYLEDDLLLDRFGSHPDRPDGLPARVRKGIRRRQTLAFYRPLVKSLRGFIGITSEESSVMAKAFPGLKCSVIRYGLPMSEFPLLALPEDGPVFGFIGNYGHEPNLDALAWLFDEVIPAVAACCPRARFIIAGKGIPAWAEGRRAGNAPIELRENVPELREFYADISIFLNPIRTGRGLRTKLIEAAAFGRPIVTTPLGGEGLADLEMGIAVDAPSFATQAARLTSGSHGREAALRNRRTVETSYALESVAAEFLALMKPQQSAGAPK
jgi:glycosyltransferase involved in cell wall biosynthesis